LSLHGASHASDAPPIALTDSGLGDKLQKNSSFIAFQGLSMVINRSVDYAVAGIIHLATLPPGAVEPVEEIARQRALPGHAFAAVVRRLARAGLVFTQRGTGGGVSLARDPSEISMRDVVEAVEGPIRLTREEGGNGTPSFTRPVWERIERAILAELEAANLAEMAQAAAPNRAAAHP